MQSESKAHRELEAFEKVVENHFSKLFQLKSKTSTKAAYLYQGFLQ